MNAGGDKDRADLSPKRPWLQNAHPLLLAAILSKVRNGPAPDPKRGQLVKAYIVLAKEAQLREGELEGFLADKLSPVEIPKLIEFRADLPKSTIGKVLKRAVSHHAEKVDRDLKSSLRALDVRRVSDF